MPVRRSASLRDALQRALADGTAADRVLVFGSFVTVGAVLREIEPY